MAEEAMERKELPDDGELFDPAHGHWSHSDMLIALVVDELRILRHAYTQVSTRKKLSPPEMVRRPGYGKAPQRNQGKRAMTPEMRMALDPRSQRRQLPGAKPTMTSDMRRSIDPRAARPPAPEE